MTERVAKIDRIINRLMTRIEDGQIINVSVGTGLYFDVSQSTLSRAVKEITNGGAAKVFYLPVKKSNGKTKVMKVLAPEKWEFVPLMANIDKIVTLVKPPVPVAKNKLAQVPAERKPLLDARDYRKIGKVANELKAKGATVEERVETAREMREAIVLEKLDAPRSMLNHRIRQLKRNGYSNVAIGKTLGISESTVRRRLNMPLEPIEILLDKTLADLEDARVAILESFMDHPESKIALDYGDKHGIRIHTNARKVSIDPKLKRVKFTLEFTAIVKDMQ